MLNWLSAAGAGVVGAMVMTIMTDTSRALGLIEANMSRYQGCIVTGRSDDTRALIAGLAFHFAMGAVLALGYAVIFRILGEASWRVGAIIGVFHWVAAGLAFPLMDRMNPCVRDHQLRAFGRFASGYGVMMVLGLFIGHVAYGAIVGAIYSLPR